MDLAPITAAKVFDPLATKTPVRQCDVDYGAW